MEKLKDILDDKGRTVWTVRPDDTVLRALGVLAEANVGAVLVTTDAGKVVGIFSERDFARHSLKHQSNLFDSPVQEFMSTKVQWAPPETNIESAMALMTKERVRHLPVFVDGRLDGVVSIGDVVKVAVAEKDHVIEQLEHYIEGSL